MSAITYDVKTNGKVQPTEKEQADLTRAFENTPPVFQLLSQLRTRRFGRGFTYETGEEEIHPATGLPQLLPEGEFKYKSQAEPVPLTEVQEALVLWAAGGPNGQIVMDLPCGVDMATFLCVAGRTIPGPCNDSQVHFFLVNDRGTFFWKPTRKREKPVEIEGPDDYYKILQWYRDGLVQLSDRRIDLSWGVPNRLMGAWQWNFNKPGTSIIIPVGEIALEQINLLLTFYEWAGWYIVDDDGEPNVGADFLREHPNLTLPYPHKKFEELCLQASDYVVGHAIANAKLAAEALGLGYWNFCGFAEDLVLGSLPEIANGLGFAFNEVNGQRYSIGREDVFESWGYPAPWWDSVDELVDSVVAYRYGKKGDFFGKGGASGSDLDELPFKREQLESFRGNPRLRYEDWTIEAVKRDVRHNVEKYGRYPVNFSPMQCNFMIQLHNVDAAYYDRFYVPGYITDRIRNQDTTWH
ncbi:hypothetical protein ACFS5L_05230 [Streptomyces phyllanthi]|uniref:Uncharacterized protein n=1 Tax=Streptomyces phyllanthi TaxID=1803180 RepID=A0A5N8W1W9_9ACTN|nr:hypothetical protein [Streptomyces phyllanthi]MPY40284.1 hypothetical protein [Streptomyces phyllanthi]